MKRFLLFLWGLIILSGCSTDSNINMGGSSSVHPLADVIKNDYCAEYPGKTISYDGPGSSKGIEGIKTGIYQFGFLSRNVKDSEVDENMVVKNIAYDGIAIIVNLDNPVSELSMQQIKDIYEGKITNWKEVGGNDEVISLIARDNASGTRSAFDEIVGIENVTQSALLYDSNGAVSQAVQQNKSSIGYISFDTYLRNSSLVKAINVDGFAPNEENVANNNYQLYRPFVMVYYPDKLSTNSKEFLSWLEQNEDRLVQEAGFIPVGDNNESTTA